MNTKDSYTVDELIALFKTGDYALCTANLSSS